MSEVAYMVVLNDYEGEPWAGLYCQPKTLEEFRADVKQAENRYYELNDQLVESSDADENKYLSEGILEYVEWYLIRHLGYQRRNVWFTNVGE